MPTETSPHWPAHLPRHLTLPATNLYFNAEVSAARYPDKPFIVFYDTPITFAEFKDETERIAGYLQQRCGVKAGDRVLLYMQNSPQWMLAYYGILRANAVVVPVNPMNMTDELRHYVEDSGARTAFVAQNLYERIAPLMGDADGQLAHTIVATYSDYLKQPSSITPPAFVSAPRHIDGGDRIGVTHWSDVLDARVAPGPLPCSLSPASCCCSLCTAPQSAVTSRRCRYRRTSSMGCASWRRYCWACMCLRCSSASDRWPCTRGRCSIACC